MRAGRSGSPPGIGGWNMLPNVGMGELIIILVIVLLLFGAKRLPEIAKGIGKSLRAFKEGTSEEIDKQKSDSSDSEKK